MIELPSWFLIVVGSRYSPRRIDGGSAPSGPTAPKAKPNRERNSRPELPDDVKSSSLPQSPNK